MAESHDINIQLGKILAKQEEMCERLESIEREILPPIGDAEGREHSIVGSIATLKNDVKQLKRAEGRREAMSRTAIGAAIVAVIGTLWALLTGKGG